MKKRDIPPTLQRPAENHLKIVSQARDPTQEFDKLDGYYYDPSAGKDITVYIIDSGLSKQEVRFHILLH